MKIKTTEEGFLEEIMAGGIQGQDMETFQDVSLISERPEQ